MAASALPFDDIRQLLALAPAAPSAPAPPSDALGRVGEIASFIRAWRGGVERPMVTLFAGSHGFSPERTRAEARSGMEAITAGTAPAAQVCRASDVGLRVFELAVDHPTGDISRESAFDEPACAATIAYGMEAIAGGSDLLCIGALGTGSNLPAAAICFAAFGGALSDWIAPGSLQEDGRLLEAACALHLTSARDGLEALRRLGGREIAAMAGAILAARTERTPVLLDGYAAAAAAATLFRLDAGALDHCLAAQAPASGPLRAAFDRLGKRPLLDLCVDAPANCAAPLAAGLVRASAALVL